MKSKAYDAAIILLELRIEHFNGENKKSCSTVMLFDVSALRDFDLCQLTIPSQIFQYYNQTLYNNHMNDT